MHDYLGGGYFITFNTHRRIPLLSQIQSGVVQLKPAGRIVADFWNALPDYYHGVVLDSLIIMPDHVHCILILTEPRLLKQDGVLKPLPEIMRGFKTMSARQINLMLNRQGVPVWQESYRDRAIRNDRELGSFREYIMTNPIRYQMNRRH